LRGLGLVVLLRRWEIEGRKWDVENSALYNVEEDWYIKQEDI
jgi:hypothetical protein